MGALFLGLSLQFACSINLNHRKEALERVARKEGELILKVSSDAPLVNKDLKQNFLQGVEIGESQLIGKSYLKDGKYISLLKINLESENLEETKKQLEKDLRVQSVSYNYIYEGNPFDMDLTTVPRPQSSFVEYQAAHHKLIGTEVANSYSRGEGIVVAVTDTGVNYEHKDLKDNIWTNSEELGLSESGTDLCLNSVDDDSNGYVDDCYGWDFSENDRDPMPYSVRDYHGSHVAGIVASKEDGEGTVGVAPGSKIMSLRFFGSGKWTSSVILNSYVYAVDNGAKIINTSFNVDKFAYDSTYLSALDYVYDHGAIVVNSAGNNSRANPLRGSLSKILFVANTSVALEGSTADLKMSSSNYGYGIDISAPGDRINSTILGDNYKRATGTSMAAPVVAGAIALIWSQNPDWTREQVVSRLLSTSKDLNRDNIRYKNMLGSGRVDLVKALSAHSQDLLSINGFASEPSIIASFFSLHFKGLVDWNTLTDDTVKLYRLDDSIDLSSDNFEQLIEDSSRELNVSITNRNKLSYGSNKLLLSNDNGKFEVGKYLLKVDQSLSDPFGVSLDGNFDSLITEDDHYYKLFEVKKLDLVAPLLTSVEVSGSKLVTPETETLQYRLKVEDDLSGFKSLSVKFSHEKTGRLTKAFKCDSDCLVDDKTVELNIDSKEITIDGFYYLSRIIIEDHSGKVSTYYASEGIDGMYRGPKDASVDVSVSSTKISALGFGKLDTVAPIMLDTPIMPSQAKKNSIVTVIFSVKEEDSGIKEVKASLYSKSLRKYIWSNVPAFKPVSGSEQKS